MKEKEIKKILVVRFRQIGDAILSSVICNTLKKSFPHAQIDYVVYDFVAPIFEKHKCIDNVIVLDKETRDKPFKYFKFVWSLMRKEKYDIVIDIMSTPKSEVFTLLSFGAKYKIGRKKINKKLGIKRRGYTYTHAITEPKDSKDKCWKFLAMLKPLEEKYEIKYDPNFTIDITEEERAYLKNKMTDAGVDFTKGRVAFAVNSRRPEKVYPKEMMLELIYKFMKKYKEQQVIFFYSPDEMAYAHEIHNELKRIDEKLETDHEMKGFSNRIFSNIKTKNIRELAMLLKNCDLFIGNEGGPRHLAQGVDTKSFAIFSPASSKKDWMPADNPRHIAIEPKDLLEELEISVDEYSNMNHEEKYRIMAPDRIIKKIEKFIKEN